MKFTVKGVCFTLLVIFSGFLLLLLPSFIMGTVKNYLIARENREVSRQCTRGEQMCYTSSIAASRQMSINARLACCSMV